MVFKRRSNTGEMLPQEPECCRKVSNAVDSSFGAARDPEDGRLREQQQPHRPQAAAEAFVPQLRHGAAADRGNRVSMEDCHIGHDDLVWTPEAAAAAAAALPSTRAFYGVFDGHGGISAAQFASTHLLDFFLAEACFPARLPDALRSSFLRVDAEFYAAVTSQREPASGSTALTALVWGNQLLVANAGDSRAVLCSAGKAVKLSTDHKPGDPAERVRISAAGGAVCPDGRLNGELTVARSFGDFHLEDLKVTSSGRLAGPLIADPEVTIHQLALADEFLLLGCDGLWDVLSDQRAVDIARQSLRVDNDPTLCSQELVKHALQLNTTDNVSVITVCFRSERPPERRTNRRPTAMGRTLSLQSLSVVNEAVNDALLVGGGARSGLQVTDAGGGVGGGLSIIPERPAAPPQPCAL